MNNEKLDCNGSVIACHNFAAGALVEPPKQGIPNLTQVIRTQRTRILNLCRKWLHHPRDAEDACQETFLRVTRAWDTFRSDCKVESWVFLIALNVCRNFNRKARRRRFDYAVEYNDALNADEGNAASSSQRYRAPDKEYERTQFLSKLEEVMKELSKSSQEILRLKITEGMTYDDVGQSLGIAPGTVKSRIFRARHHLKQCVDV